MTLHRRFEHLLLVRDSLSPDDRRRLDRHVSECPDCRESVAQLQREKALFQPLGNVTPPSGIRQAVLAASPAEGSSWRTRAGRFPPRPSWPSSKTVSRILGAATIVAAAGWFVFAALTQGQQTSRVGVGPSARQGHPGAAVPGGPFVGQVGCNHNEQITYHVHAHLSVYDAGKPVTIPAYIGFNFNHDCLYWLHTHDTSGVIHIESPRAIRPTLGTFFRVWRKPLTAGRVGPTHLRPGQSVKVYVDQKPYFGNPSRIVLGRHTDVQIDIGPPFPPPRGFDYRGL